MQSPPLLLLLEHLQLRFGLLRGRCCAAPGQLPLLHQLLLVHLVQLLPKLQAAGMHQQMFESASLSQLESS
jgi:hypothetical protein